MVDLGVSSVTGALVSEGLKLLIREAKLVLAFDFVSKEFASTMESLLPIITQIETMQDVGELKILEENIEEARVIVLGCSSVQSWNFVKKSRYMRKMEEIDRKIFKFCQVQLQLLLYRNQSQFMPSIEAIEKKVLNDSVDSLVASAPPGCGKTTLAIQEIKAEQCGRQAGGAVCPGNTDEYCWKPGCQSQCTPGGGDLSGIITSSQFDVMLMHRNDDDCPARGFYTYDAFITAAKSFPGFGTTGDTATKKKEIAAFFGQTSHETTGGWATAPDGPYSWGYYYKQEYNPVSDYYSPSAEWPCAAGKRYYGRGPMQLTWNFNYGLCGRAIGADLINNPDLVTNDPVIAFKTAIWFWMTPQSPKPSCHAVIVGQWQPSVADHAAGRLPGYGVITNIINGGLECGRGQDARVADRIGFYQRYCDIFGVNSGPNLDCYNQRSFASVFLDAAI